ncbi:TIR domain-containing protein [Methanosarcina siciliae]|uniref:TIR domain-containing protein n=1 Tax=Methanosarcina siciliae TaxID=38027 RepID=UPI001C9C4AD0|nr:TIR domain-containing protein [Methanosarcina siciliae]
MNEEKLRNQFIAPYENGENIIVNGKTISSDDIERIKINKTEVNSAKLIPIIRAKMTKKAAATLLPKEWYVTKEGEDVTDDFIKGEPGYKKKKPGEKMVEVKPKGDHIFVVHGHDEGMKQAVARTLEKLDLKPIILHEQPNQGRTIIEKFAEYANSVSFAVVLLSPDDIGYRKDQSSEAAKFRARQNVILELGFFLGTLGRHNVVTLFKNDLNFEGPSDYDGVLYMPFDNSGRWQFDLVRELKSAGYNVDANKLV